MLLGLAIASPKYSFAQATKVEPDLRRSVVQITGSRRAPDLFRPWQKEKPEKTGGSGLVIDGERILTNAHVVEYATELFIQAADTGPKLPATVVGVAPGMDLAVLSVKDKSFFKNRPAIPRATKTPRVKDTVAVYGFPIGGTGLSITKGVVSRIEFTEYNMPTYGLRIQVDAAINPGNSGGPAVVDDQLVGVAFAGLVEGENIGYIIPTEEIELFLNDLGDGRYDGKFGMFDEVQPIENDALRTKLHLAAGDAGLLVNIPCPAVPNSPLKPNDVVSRIGGSAVDDEGNVIVGELRLSYKYVAQKLGASGKLPITLIRDGKSQNIELPLARGPNFVLKPLDGQYPSYFVFGPLAFTTATLDYVSAFLASDDKEAREAVHALIDRQSPLITRCNADAAFADEQLVIVSAIFPHRLSRGYDDAIHQVVTHVNGKAVRNLRHLVELLRDSQDQHLDFRFADRPPLTVVLDRKEALDAMEDILSDNGVRNVSSPDLRAVWEAKK
jgi:S1-C subfamily serine protease